MNGDWAVCFLYKIEEKRKVEFDWSRKYISDDISGRLLNTRDNVFIIRDLWAKKNLGSTNKKLISQVEPHDVLMLRLVKQ